MAYCFNLSACAKMNMCQHVKLINVKLINVNVVICIFISAW